MTHDQVFYEVEERAATARERYGDFASTHEALGVALEEWQELCDAVRSNALGSVEQECIDLAAVLIRLAQTIRNRRYVWERSTK
jgi:NTP pyrophosphatase (non-canonical NTP hydrolase)